MEEIVVNSRIAITISALTIVSLVAPLQADNATLSRRVLQWRPSDPVVDVWLLLVIDRLQQWRDTLRQFLLLPLSVWSVPCDAIPVVQWLYGETFAQEDVQSQCAISKGSHGICSYGRAVSLLGVSILDGPSLDISELS